MSARASRPMDPIPPSLPFRDAHDHLHELATAMTRLDDFGDDEYEDGLRALLASLDDDADLSPDGRRAAAGIVVTALAGRLEANAAWKAHPELHRAPLRAPIVVVGLPRTGTTALHRMLCAIDGHQGLELWLAQSPRPRPPRAQWEADPAYGRCVAMLEAQHRASPEMAAIHEMAADRPDECWNLLRQSFASVTFECVFAVSGYSAWWAACDMKRAYARWADGLRLVGGREPDRRFVLKDPSHLFAPEALLAAVPDATVVMTHRDPAKAIPSVCSLNATARRANDRVPDLARLGAEQLELWARGIERTMRARERAPERFVDVHFDELRARPHDVVRRILAHAAASTPGAPFRVGDADAALDAWLAANPSRPHRYDAGAFGLDAARIRERLADYVRRFDVALEGAD